MSARSTKTTNEKPKRLLVLLVQPRQLGEHLRLGAALLLGGLADPGVRRQRRDLIVLGERERHLLGDGERILALGELVDEPGSPREERRQLLDAQLPR